MAFRDHRAATQRLVDEGCDHYLMGGSVIMLPCTQGGCWGISKHKGSGCSRGCCTRNTGKPDQHTFEGRLLAIGSGMTTEWAGPLD